MGLLKEYRSAQKARKNINAIEVSQEVLYYQQQNARLQVERDLQNILNTYYDDGECELIPVIAPDWAIPIMMELLDKDNIKYIGTEKGLNIIYD